MIGIFHLVGFGGEGVNGKDVCLSGAGKLGIDFGWAHGSMQYDFFITQILGSFGLWSSFQVRYPA